jgi:hypothetical protein
MVNFLKLVVMLIRRSRFLKIENQYELTLIFTASNHNQSHGFRLLLPHPLHIPVGGAVERGACATALKIFLIKT